MSIIKYIFCGAEDSLICPPVRRMSGIQIITSPFGMRKLKGKRAKMHNGVDLRSVRFLKGTGYVPQWGLQSIVATELCSVARIGTDRKGNDYIVVKPLYTKSIREIKYIHVIVSKKIKRGDILRTGDYIGKTQIKGSSKNHHLHFEVWRKRAINPLEYFEMHQTIYKMKRG